MKKMLAIFLSVLMLMSVASAFADEAAELVWWGWTPGSPVNESFIEEFNKTYPDIKVTWKQVSIDDYDATIKPALAYGEGVDIYECSAGSANGGIEVFASQALDLTEALKAAVGDDYADKISETSLTTMTVNGELKALGVGTVYAGNLWINKDLFDKYGVAIPTNMEEWKAAVKGRRTGCLQHGHIPCDLRQHQSRPVHQGLPRGSGMDGRNLREGPGNLEEPV